MGLSVSSLFSAFVELNVATPWCLSPAFSVAAFWVSHRRTVAPSHGRSQPGDPSNDDIQMGEFLWKKCLQLAQCTSLWTSH